MRRRASEGFRRICAIAFAAALVASAGRFWWRTGLFWNGLRPDPVAPHEAKLERLRALLPPAGRVGYVSAEQSGREFSSANRWGFVNDKGRVEFFLTQYALAPLVVLNERTQELLVVPDIERAPRVPGYAPVLGARSGSEVLRRRSGGR